MHLNYYYDVQRNIYQLVGEERKMKDYIEEMKNKFENIDPLNINYQDKIIEVQQQEEIIEKKNKFFSIE